MFSLALCRDLNMTLFRCVQPAEPTASWSDTKSATSIGVRQAECSSASQGWRRLRLFAPLRVTMITV